MRLTHSAVEAELASSILSSARRTPKYKTIGGNRFTSRTQTSLKAGSSGWVEQDVNTLYRTGNYHFTIPVKGKTDDYKVTILIEDFLTDLNKILEKEQFKSTNIQQALQRAISIRRIKVSCTCPDFTYRYSYSMTIAGNKAGEPETRPSVKTNPEYAKGACKHIIAVLTNKSWIPQIATNLHTYTMTIYNRNRTLFDKIIRPALNNISDEQMGFKQSKQLPPIQPLQPLDTTAQTSAKQANTGSTEAINSAYIGSQQYDEDQQLMISVAIDNGADIQPYITPENTPEQILELANAFKLGIPESFIIKLSNTTYSPMTIKVLAEVKKKYNLDWTRFSEIHPNILEYLANYYNTTGITPADFEGNINIREARSRVRSALRD
jgi:hypothetical protein